MQVRTLPAAVLFAAVFLTGCGSSGGGPVTAVPPPASGEVWEIDPRGGRPAAPGALLAYLHGLHVLVLDGSTLYAGMTRIKPEARAEGTLAIPLGGGQEALLVRNGEALELRFSSGESIALRRKTVPPARKS